MHIRISGRAADRLRAGHVWVYRSDLGGADGQLNPDMQPGSLVTVEDGAGRPLGTALYSSSSQIALRVISRSPELTRNQYLSDLRVLVGQALQRRRLVAPVSTESGRETNAQRLIFSEADGLPGIVADRYADLVVVQLLAQGTAQEDVRAALAEALRAELAPHGEPLTIWERPDPLIRKLEQLPPPPGGPLFSSSISAEAPASAPPLHESRAPSTTIFALNGLQFSYDAEAGQKTGAFLDQRLNYAAAADWVRRSGHTGHALDVCTYQGGFAIHLAQVCAQVTGVDQSRSALEAAERNLALNPKLKAEVGWIEADAFDLLRALDEAAHPGTNTKRRSTETPAGLPPQFDAIVLDPPAFAKSKRATEGALRGYKELNLRAIRLLAPGGTLVTCSCSHHVSLEAFAAAITEAAAAASRRVQLLETRSAAPDHPEVLTIPETRYLKCLICRVE